MKHYLFRCGDGNDGNFPRFIVTFRAADDIFAGLVALVANRYIPGSRTRRHLLQNLETDGCGEFGAQAWCHEGPRGESAYGSAWVTAELEPLTADALAYYRGRYDEHVFHQYLDRGARVWYRRKRHVESGAGIISSVNLRECLK